MLIFILPPIASHYAFFSSDEYQVNDSLLDTSSIFCTTVLPPCSVLFWCERIYPSSQISSSKLCHHPHSFILICLCTYLCMLLLTKRWWYAQPTIWHFFLTMNQHMLHVKTPFFLWQFTSCVKWVVFFSEKWKVIDSSLPS